MATLTWTVPKESKTLFCPHCNSIMELPDEMNVIKCYDCPYTSKIKREDTSASAQVQVKHYETNDGSGSHSSGGSHMNPTMRRAKVKEPCPKCNYEELRFYTMQMRSVDEGQTVFYECEKCGHTYSTNT